MSSKVKSHAFAGVLFPGKRSRLNLAGIHVLVVAGGVVRVTVELELVVVALEEVEGVVDGEEVCKLFSIRMLS